MRRVAITGLGCISPVGLDTETSWKAALNAESGVDLIGSFDSGDLAVKIAAEVKGFDPANYIDAKEANRSTRFIQFALAAAKEALLDSALLDSIDPELVGTSIGVGIGGIDHTVNTSQILFERGSKRVSPFFIPYTIPNMAAGLVANTHNLKGPNICVSTACTSGTHAIGEAYLLIKNNMADAMLCGGAEAAICKLTVASFGNMKALSTTVDNPREASRPFDLERNGFILGEAAGILILEEMERARSRGAKIYAEVVGYGMSGDAYHITAPSPEGEGAKRCMAMALKTSGIRVDEMDYINAHGTSTKLNDLYETKAIQNLFGAHAEQLAISSTKGVTGHCLGAAGGIEGVFLAKSIAEQRVPPTAHLKTPDPECPLDYVAGGYREMDIRYGMSNSFGFGGTNGSVVFKRVF
ncbi:MAG: beta-ketoacyl-ACP synthase II [Bdellovibrionota bacterium]